MENNGGGSLSAKLNEEKMAVGLAWFSIGLGLMECTAPRSVARMMGMRAGPGLVRFLGIREIAHGVGILTGRKPSGWLWSRVAGDALDLSILGVSLVSNRGKRGRAAMATAAIAGITALDVLTSQKMTQNNSANLRAVRTKKTVTVNRSPEELFRVWHNFEDLPKFMNHLISVSKVGENRWHWVAKGPAGTTVEWDAEIVYEKPNELIAWKSLEGADVDNSGSVRFEAAPGGRGTVVRVELEYEPPAGRLGAGVAKMFGQAPEKQVAVDLYRFKQLLETGEIARTEGQPAGRSRSTSRKYDDLVRGNV